QRHSRPAGGGLPFNGRAITGKRNMAENANSDDDEFTGIPDMPSDDSIRSEVIRTGGIEHWNPRGAARTGPVDFTALSKDMANKVLAARLAMGPGPNANAFQHAIWDQHRRIAELDNEHDRIVKQLDEVRRFE